MGGERSINLRSRTVGVPPAVVVRSAAAVMLVLMTAAALTIVARRAAGALETPLEPTAMFATGLLVAAAAIMIRLGWLLPSVASPVAQLDQAVMLVASLAVLASGLGLCLPEGSVVGRFLLCIVLTVEESWAWGWYQKRRGQNGGSPSLPPEPVLPLPRSPVSEIDGSESFAEDVTQRLTRSLSADGSETLSGWLRAPFVVGQRTGSVHVAFCPPFAAMPELEVEQVDGPEARIKTAQLLPYGVRFDLKLAAPAEEPVFVVLQFSVQTA